MLYKHKSTYTVCLVQVKFLCDMLNLNIVNTIYLYRYNILFDISQLGALYQGSTVLGFYKKDSMMRHMDFIRKTSLFWRGVYNYFFSSFKNGSNFSLKLWSPLSVLIIWKSVKLRNEGILYNNEKDPTLRVFVICSFWISHVCLRIYTGAKFNRFLPTTKYMYQ